MFLNVVALYILAVANCSLYHVASDNAFTKHVAAGKFPTDKVDIVVEITSGPTYSFSLPRSSFATGSELGRAIHAKLVELTPGKKFASLNISSNLEFLGTVIYRWKISGSNILKVESRAIPNSSDLRLTVVDNHLTPGEVQCADLKYSHFKAKADSFQASYQAMTRIAKQLNLKGSSEILNKARSKLVSDHHRYINFAADMEAHCKLLLEFLAIADMEFTIALMDIKAKYQENQEIERSANILLSTSLRDVTPESVEALLELIKHA